jgi:branched-chain amino acid aminotransferase
MQMPFSREELNDAQRRAVRENGLDSAYIRPMCFYGSEGMGLRADNLRVHCMVAAWAWGAYLGEEGINKGIRIRVSSFTRHHVNITMCRAKANGNYMNSMLALREALDTGYDEALLLDANGFVMEGSGENIFIVRDGVLYTPDLTSCLDGITRRTVMQLAAEEGLQVVERRITRDEVYIADEAFFTGTAAEVTPIREVDGRDRQRQSRAHHRAAAEQVLRRRARAQRRAHRLVEPGLNGAGGEKGRTREQQHNQAQDRGDQGQPGGSPAELPAP